MPMIYLDNNATTPVDPEVCDTICSSLKRDFGNPSSIHPFGRRAKEIIEHSRVSAAGAIGCSHEEIYFTSGGTESNNMALIGHSLLQKGGHIITSSIEHPSVSNTCAHLEERGFHVTYVPVDRNGTVILDAVRKAIRRDTFLISIMHANNETGTIQPIEEIGMLKEDHGIVLHVDAAQSVGKMIVDVSDLLVDMMTIASHKFYGPKGIGALYIRKGVRMKSILYGAGHEKGLRPGTENVASISGFGKACHIAQRDITMRVSHTTTLRELLYTLLKSELPDMKLNGHETRRLPNTLNVSIPGILSSLLVDKIKEYVAVSTGSACHEGVQTPSRVLKQMGLSDEAALSSLRLSIGKDNTQEEIREAADSIVRAVKTLRARK